MDINLDKIWISQHIQMDIWLVVWNIFYFSIQLGIRWTTDFHMFQKGRSTTNQICFTMDIFDMLIHFGYGSMDQNWASQHNFSWSKLPLLVPLKILVHTFDGWSIMFPVWNVEVCCINIIINHPSFWETHLEFCWFSSMIFPAINLYRWTFPSCRAPFSFFLATFDDTRDHQRVIWPGMLCSFC